MKAIKLISIAVIATTLTLSAGKNVAPVKSPVLPVAIPIGLYVGIGAIWAPTSIDCPCSGNVRKYDNPLGGVARIGYDFNQYFGIEGRYLKAKYSRNFATVTHYGIYLKPQYHITNAVNVYGLIGYGKTTIDCNYKTKPLYDGSGLSFGAGIEYDLSKDTSGLTSGRAFDGEGDQEQGFGVWIDYQNLLYNKGAAKVRANVVTAGVTYDF